MSDRNNKVQKQKYITDIGKLRSILNDADYLGVMPDAPDDEYDDEAARLLALCKRSANLQEFTEATRLLFEERFGNTIPQESSFVRSLCDRIWTKIKN